MNFRNTNIVNYIFITTALSASAYVFYTALTHDQFEITRQRVVLFRNVITAFFIPYSLIGMLLLKKIAKKHQYNDLSTEYVWRVVNTFFSKKNTSFDMIVFSTYLFTGLAGYSWVSSIFLAALLNFIFAIR